MLASVSPPKSLAKPPYVTGTEGGEGWKVRLGTVCGCQEILYGSFNAFVCFSAKHFGFKDASD